MANAREKITSHLKEIILKFEKELELVLKLNLPCLSETMKSSKLNLQFLKSLLIYNYELAPLLLKKIEEQNYILCEIYDADVKNNKISEGLYLEMMDGLKNRNKYFKSIYTVCLVKRSA